MTKDFFFRHKDGRGYAIIATTRMFKQIELVIGMFVAEGERPPATSEELSPWLQEQHGRLEVVRDKKTGAVVDRWGTPIRLIVKSPTDYTLVSLGPNREDDG